MAYEKQETIVPQEETSIFWKAIKNMNLRAGKKVEKKEKKLKKKK